MLPLSIKVEYIIRFKKTMYLMQWCAWINTLH